MTSRFPLGSRRRPRRAGFTLVELLVVIGIIAVLIALLLPVLSRASESARGVNCLSNLRQIGSAVTSYSFAFDGQFPPLEVASELTAGRFWVSKLVSGKYLTATENSERNVLTCPSARNEVNTAFWVNATNRREDRGFFRFNTQADGVTELHAASYAANGSFDSAAAWWEPTRPYTEWFPFVMVRDNAPSIRPRPVRMSSIREPTQVVAAFDGLYGHNQVAHNFNTRHGSSDNPNDLTCNFVFIDGHAAAVAGSELPGGRGNTVTNPSLYGRNELNNPNEWAIRLTVKPIP